MEGRLCILRRRSFLGCPRRGLRYNRLAQLALETRLGVVGEAGPGELALVRGAELPLKGVELVLVPVHLLLAHRASPFSISRSVLRPRLKRAFTATSLAPVMVEISRAE